VAKSFPLLLFLFSYLFLFFISISLFLYFLLRILGKRPHFTNHPLFYSSKLKTEPVKIAFLVDKTPGIKGSNGRAVDAYSLPLVAAKTPDNANSARLGISFRHVFPSRFSRHP
jgi:hypothetical protein